MYAVIFKAQIKHIDDEYHLMARRMRQLAINHYGCLDFSSCTDGDQEISISYWESEDDIVKWKQEPEHMAAQEIGRNRWYASYTIEVMTINRRYKHEL